MIAFVGPHPLAIVARAEAVFGVLSTGEVPCYVISIVSWYLCPYCDNIEVFLNQFHWFLTYLIIYNYLLDILLFLYSKLYRWKWCNIKLLS